MLKVGDIAPDFELKDHRGHEVRLSDYRGKMVVLWFYPQADTPGCISQGIGFRDRIHEFEAQGVQILGVSRDSVEENAAFAAKYKLPFPLLSDTERQVCTAYGVCPGERAERVTFVIGSDGKIMQAYENIDDVSGHADTILKSLKPKASQEGIMTISAAPPVVASHHS